MHAVEDDVGDDAAPDGDGDFSALCCFPTCVFRIAELGPSSPDSS